jgi:glycosyltransferase involved in cell wall biosynthesis
MRILLITNGYPPQRWAGTETYSAGIAQELHARGYQVQVLCGGDWHTGNRYWNGFLDDEHQGVPVRRLCLNWLKAPDPFAYLYNNPVVADFLEGYLKDNQPDLVHVTSCETLSASILQVVKDAAIPLVLSLTDFWFLCPRINLLRGDGENCNGLTTDWECLRCMLHGSKAYRWPSRMLPENRVARLLTAVSQYPRLTRQPGLRGMAGNMTDRKAFLQAALHWPGVRITASHFVRNVHIAAGVSEPIRVQPYGHDLAWLKSYSGKEPSETIRVGFIGQIIPSKGVHLLLQAARILQDGPERNKFSLLIYGNLEKEPAYGAQLRDLAAGMTNVQFCGTYAHDQSAAVFTGLDVLVVPSMWYDFPLIIHEAFATKTPVVATNIGGMAEAVTPGIDGFLFDRGSAHDLAAQLRRIVVEPNLLARLQAGTPRVKRIEEEVEELEKIYRELVQNQPSHH